MNVSVLDPITPAIERTRQMLFSPFDFQKWITLGFCAFLANLGFGNVGGGNFRFDQSWFDKNRQWLIDNYELIVLGVMGFVLFLAIVSTVVMWLSSRGQFMFVAGVARDLAAVREPCGEFREQGKSLFWFRVWFSFAMFLVVLAAIVACTLLALADIRAEQFGPMSAISLALGLTTALVVATIWTVVSVFLYDFVVPIMYSRHGTVRGGWSEFNRVIFAEHKGTLVLYLLFQIVLWLAITVISTLACCITCCIAEIPFVGTVILLPLFVFHRAYTLYFLEQFGPEWKFLTDH